MVPRKRHPMGRRIKVSTMLSERENEVVRAAAAFMCMSIGQWLRYCAISNSYNILKGQDKISLRQPIRRHRDTHQAEEAAPPP